MMNVTYAVAEEKYALGEEKRTSYGIVAIAHMKSLAHFFLCEIKSLSRLNGEEP